jgi:NAD(P)-dependent dehydrogenase (short-subunit alcohol dehydrogenase family)
MKVEGKVALVTGGASGMGKGFTDVLIANGAKVRHFVLNHESFICILTV